MVVWFQLFENIRKCLKKTFKSSKGENAMDITGSTIGSVIFAQVSGNMSPIPMAVLTKEGMFFGMELYEGSEQIRKDESDNIAEIIFLVLGRLGDQEYFRWLKEGEEAQLKPPSKYYRVLDILQITPGR